MFCAFIQLFRYPYAVPVWNTINKFMTSANRNNLMQFFDDPSKWGETSITTGRPWTKAELSVKSNSDLHNLWYILLKERNMLMTMEEEHNRCLERMPNPDRFEKVEESMENLLLAVQERNQVHSELEDGQWTGPTVQPTIDVLGRPCHSLTSEHVQPRNADTSAQADEAMWGDKNIELLRLEREKKMQSVREKKRKQRIVTRSDRWKQLDYLDDSSIETIHPH